MTIYMDIKFEIIKTLRLVGITGEIELTAPPKPEMGDYAFACFGLAKERKNSPVEMAKKLAEDLRPKTKDCCEKVEAFGPYINFFVNPKYLVETVLGKKQPPEGALAINKKIIIEFACPNTHKAFHIGHLRNIITGESVARILDYVGHKVIRANYQGDVGLHIAKCLWALTVAEVDDGKDKTLEEKVKILGAAYAKGAKAFEENENFKKEIVEINDKIYSQDKSIKKIYTETRQWSLEYFDKIYARVGAHFDRFYFESETYADGIKLVNEYFKKGVFEKGEGGAIIFPGEKYDLHSRVFITAKGFPTYEAKDQALARLQFEEYKPNKILHVVGKEQTEYFKVIFKALEFTYPPSKGKEEHLDYGWVSLKDGKMSSRTGNVILGEWLLDSVKEEVKKVMKEAESLAPDTAEKIAVAAVKYAFLKTGVKNDISFDLKESVSLTGDSGPYLLYILARIKSILAKAGKLSEKIDMPEEIVSVEKKMLLQLAESEDATFLAAQNYDPSQIAKYLFNLARAFNDFYENCPVLGSAERVKNFRLRLISKVGETMDSGLNLLGIKSVDKM